MEQTNFREVEVDLAFAKRNLENLNSIEEILGNLLEKIKQEDEKTTCVINETFENIAASLSSRKNKLLGDLKTNTWAYMTDVIKFQESVTKKRKDLNTAVQLVEELKEKHFFFQASDNLSQVVSSLKIIAEDEILKIDTLTKKILPRFSKDCEEILLINKNIEKLCLTRPIESCTKFPCQSERVTQSQYYPPIIPPVFTEHTVRVTYCISPGEFYLQLLEYGPEFTEFMQEIKRVYRNESGENFEVIYPMKGQTCIARFEDGDWYRAEVIDLLDHQEVVVRYVDLGKISQLSMKDIRKIKGDFLAFPEKAIRCKLAYVEPRKGEKEWNIKSNHRFEEVVTKKNMLCFITEKSQDNILTVELYEHRRELSDYCFNISCLLVGEQLASYIYSSPHFSGPSCEHGDLSIEEILRSGENISQLGDHSQIESFRDAKVTHVVSPSKIFFRFLSSEKYLERLQEKMTDFYRESENETIDWQVNMNCAVYMHDLDEWRRGQIHRKISEHSVEVFFFDFGEIKVMTTTSLRQLDDDLKTVKPLAVECSLGLRPVGGTEEWTETACERLVQYLNGTIVNLSIQDSNTPFLVKIFNKDGDVNIDIAEQIIDEGLAVRKSEPHIFLNKHEIVLEEIYQGTQNAYLQEEKSVIYDGKESPRIKSTRNRIAEFYKPPFIPSTDQFTATVSCVADNGIIYVMPKSQENVFQTMMNDIQNTLRSKELLKSHFWKKGDPCAVKASDTLWYRGQVIELASDSIYVKYIDLGYIEMITQCQLYPIVLYADIPLFSVPCQLYKTVPVGKLWKKDAVEIFQKLLLERLVEVYIMEPLTDPWGKLSVKIYLSGTSISAVMAWHKHCNIEEDGAKMLHQDESEDENYEEWQLCEGNAPILSQYILPSLPVIGTLFPVCVRHVMLPNKVFLAFDHSDDASQKVIGDSKMLKSDAENLEVALKHCNKNIHTFHLLTSFQKDMPCLAQYIDGMWYRGKINRIVKFSPLAFLVTFVDYGATETLTTDKLRKMPCHLLKYPVQAFKVQLIGFKPAVSDFRPVRIPHCTEWSLAALQTMVNCLKGKHLIASSVMYSPEHTVFLYEDGHLVHIQLVEKGFAEFVP